MTKEDKELFLKDLCARLPYGVKVAFFNEDLTLHSEHRTLIGIECINNLNYSRLEDEDDDVVYCMEEIDYDWTDEMIEGLAEEEVLLYIDDFQDDNEIIDIIDEYVHRLKDNECQINLPEGYQFKDENGNVINATKIVLEKKKK